jgi:hypothetical protein
MAARKANLVTFPAYYRDHATCIGRGGIVNQHFANIYTTASSS